jgi:hypothetical protein
MSAIIAAAVHLSLRRNWGAGLAPLAEEAIGVETANGWIVRRLGNIFLLALAMLIVLGVYVFRTELFSDFQRSKKTPISVQTAKQRGLSKPLPAFQARRVRTAKQASAVVDPKPKAAVTGVEPKQTPDSIEVGMGKATLSEDFPLPAVMISSRDGRRFLQTYIYLVSRNKATVVRVANDFVISVQGTKTVDPPLLVAHGTTFQVVSTSADSK